MQDSTKVLSGSLFKVFLPRLMCVYPTFDFTGSTFVCLWTAAASWKNWMFHRWGKKWKAFSISWQSTERNPPSLLLSECVLSTYTQTHLHSSTVDCDFWLLFFFLVGWWSGSRVVSVKIHFWTRSWWELTPGWRRANVWSSNGHTHTHTQKSQMHINFALPYTLH